MAINIFAPALASFIYRVYFGTGSDLKQIVTMPSIAIPGLKDIPVIGPLLFDQSPMVYLTFVLVIVTAVFFGKTRAGLSYKSVGEHPQAAATLGINVIGVKYLACVICGALSGIGGGIYYLAGTGQYVIEKSILGMGFNGIPVALLALNNPIAVIFTGIFMAMLNIVGLQLTNLTAYNEYITDVIISVIVYLSAFSLAIRMMLSRKKKPHAHVEETAAPAADAAPPEEPAEEPTEPAEPAAAQTEEGGDQA